MSMKTMMESMRRGAAAGTRIAVTGRAEYRSPIQVKSAGTPSGGMEQGRPDSSRVNGTGEGVQQVALQWRSAPLPTVDEFAGYERIQPGAADRIITMAEKSLDAEIEAQRTSNEVAAKDHKAQNICMIIATIAYSVLPIIGFGSAVVCAAL